MRVILVQNLPSRFIIIGIILFSLLSCSKNYEDQQEFFEKVQVQALQLKEELIADFKINSMRPTNWTLIFSGARMYTDRSYTYETVPSELMENLTLQPANEDKFHNEVDPPFITFRLKKSAKVYILTTPIATTLGNTWLNEDNGWGEEKFFVETTLWAYKSRRFIKSQYFPQDTLVELGGNGCLQDNCDTFTVVIVPELKDSEKPANDLDHI